MIPKQTEFTRRIPLLSMKQMDIDAKVAKKMVHAWDVLHSPERLREVFFQVPLPEILSMSDANASRGVPKGQRGLPT